MAVHNKFRTGERLQKYSWWWGGGGALTARRPVNPSLIKGDGIHRLNWPRRMDLLADRKQPNEAGRRKL